MTEARMQRFLAAFQAHRASGWRLATGDWYEVPAASSERLRRRVKQGIMGSIA